MTDTAIPSWMRPGRGLDSNVIFPQVTITWDISAALEELHHCGLSEADRSLHNSLLIALTHESFAYEHQREMLGVTRGLLNGLISLGANFVGRTAAVHFYQQRVFVRPGPLSNIIAVAKSSVPKWAEGLDWVRDCAAISKGLDRKALPRRVSGNLLKQVLGVLCLTGNDHVANRLISDLLTLSGRDPEGDGEDPRTRLQQILGPIRLNIEYQVTGVEHKRHFEALMVDERGRRSAGAGRSKKEAARNASIEFLSRHLSREAGATRSGIRPSNQGSRPAAIADVHSEWHVHAIRRICELFRLEEEDLPLLSQALIHSSWTYEHQETTARTRQQDNQVLGLVGSHVLEYEYNLRIARVALADKPHELSFLTLDREPYERAFYHLGLANAFLLGFGQASQGIMAEMAANAFQAVMAAVYISRGCPASLLDDWPFELTRLREIVIPAEPRPPDSVTLLQETCAAAKLIADYSFEESGPDHQKRYRATVHMKSTTLNRQINIVGGGVLAGKATAKQEIATTILEVFDSLAEAESLARLVVDDNKDTRIAGFLLAHLALKSPNTEAEVRRWMNAGLFGTHLAKDAGSLREWAKQADRLLSFQQIVVPDIPSLTNLFITAVRLSADRDNKARGQLSTILAWLDSLSGPEDIGEQEVLRLVQVCDLYRALGSTESNVDLRRLVDEWKILYGDKIAVMSDVPAGSIDCVQRAAIDAVINLLLNDKQSLQIQFSGGLPLHLNLIARNLTSSRFMSEVCALWSSASPMLDAVPTDDGVNVILNLSLDETEAGQVESAVTVAVRPSPAPYGSAVADLLHDMKNQLVAARQALTSPAHGRTARLAREASASGHLDQAVAIGRRLGAVSSLLGPLGSEVTELGTFLRRYAAGLLRRLPSSVSLTVPPSGAREVEIALDEASLTAILDNLVNNAVEAMPNGGSVRLDWTADDLTAVIEVADDGPGLPPYVVRALDTGGRIASTKDGGNGVGILSVRTLLRRAGGELTAVTNPSGTAWMLVIPCARLGGE